MNTYLNKIAFKWILSSVLLLIFSIKLSALEPLVEVGNLIKKESLTETWKYRWTQGGMLSKVIRPDRKHVDFTYDALGRRLTKTYQDRTTHFVWDGSQALISPITSKQLLKQGEIAGRL